MVAFFTGFPILQFQAPTRTCWYADDIHRRLMQMQPLTQKKAGYTRLFALPNNQLTY